MMPSAFFVTRPKANTRFRVHQAPATCASSIGDGFTIIDDADVVLASKGDSRLPIPLRRIRVKRDKGGTITLITNDLERTAVEIAALYKGRWQIELLFRWIKQHLEIRKFLGNNDNAIRLQIFAAMIAYLLLRIAARVHPRHHARSCASPNSSASSCSRANRSPRSTNRHQVNPSQRQTKTPPPINWSFCYA